MNYNCLKTGYALQKTGYALAGCALHELSPDNPAKPPGGEKTGIELQTFTNRTLASSAQNYTHKLFVKDQEILHLKKQIKKRNKIIRTLSALLIATSIITMLLWAWAIHLRDSIIWHNYTEHNNNNIENVVADEVE